MITGDGQGIPGGEAVPPATPGKGELYLGDAAQLQDAEVPAPDESFPHQHRILKRRDFLRTYEQGRRVYGRLAVMFAYRREDAGPWRIGLTVTKKTAGAVGRNRQRRRLREFFRRRPGLLPDGWDVVINVKAAALSAEHESWERDLLQILARLGFGGEPGKGSAQP